MAHVDWIALIIFVLLFGFITWLGFAAARWRRGDLNLLHEWGLGGRRFGTIVTWFLVGGDLYTAYSLSLIHIFAQQAIDLGARGTDPIYGHGLVGEQFRIVPSKALLSKQAAIAAN